MAIAETKKKTIEETKKAKFNYRIIPRYGVWNNEDNIIIQVAIPGVKKENIEMKTLPDYFTLRALRDDVLFSLDLELGAKIEPEQTKAKYEEGLLRLELKRYKPLEHAYIVSIE